MKEQLVLQKILRTKLNEQLAKNPAYSLRAFAKRVGLSPTTLSLILNGKRKVSEKLAAKISHQLALDPQERAELLGQFPKAKRLLQKEYVDPSYMQLTADQYQIIADWRAFAILSLIPTKGFQSDKKWIADRLGISVEATQQTVERLHRVGMLNIDAQGTLSRTAERFRTTDDIVNLSLRKSHYQNLDLARESLNKDPLDLRDFTWLTMPFDLKKMNQAKTLIRKFQDDLLELVSEDAEPTEVYRLSLQFFPFTKQKGQKK